MIDLQIIKPHWENLMMFIFGDFFFAYKEVDFGNF